jgi:hypothetical protein
MVTFVLQWIRIVHFPKHKTRHRERYDELTKSFCFDRLKFEVTDDQRIVPDKGAVPVSGQNNKSYSFCSRSSCCSQSLFMRYLETDVKRQAEIDI